MADRLWK